MKILWLCLFLHSVLTQNNFGTSYLKNSKLCHQWNCINTKLNLPNALPPRTKTAEVLRSLLPDGAWQNVVETVLDGCYGKRYKRYTNTCPGQSLLHCIVDNLIQNCPDENLRKSDACAPLSSLAGFKYMFAQSRYDNLEKNLPKEHRPEWFLKNYFNSKCCDLPPIFNATVLSECEFTTIVNYYKHTPNHSTASTTMSPLAGAIRNRVTGPHSNHIETSTPAEDTVRMVDLDTRRGQNNIGSSEFRDSPAIVNNAHLPKLGYGDNDLDPLNCCDMDQFIHPAWRSDCGFELRFSGNKRLTIVNRTLTRPTTTAAPAVISRPRSFDIKVLPLKCEKEICIFHKLNIVSESGSVDRDAFWRLLNNITNYQPEWTKAKARVYTRCLSKPLKGYDNECEINNVLTCTFDVLSENCPYANKIDPCKHLPRNPPMKPLNPITCQISSSKIRPKNRRQYCGPPHFVNQTILKECGVDTFFQTEITPEPSRHRARKNGWFSSAITCKDLTHSTSCLLQKMDVLNKYKFMDYFKMKDQIRRFTSNNSNWTIFTDIYLSRLTTIPLYKEHCSSPKKLLNIIDVMLSTCPMPHRKDSWKCNKFFEEIIKTPRDTRQFYEALWSHFAPSITARKPVHKKPLYGIDINKSKTDTPGITVRKHIHKNPLYDFGILNSKSVPPISTIDVTTRGGYEKINDYESRKPSVILPVYLRSDTKHGYLDKHSNDTLRNADTFALHKKIVAAHFTESTDTKKSESRS